MALFIQLNGTTDCIKTSAITFDEVIMDFKARQQSGKYYFDARTGSANSYLFRHSSGVEATSASGQFFNGMYWNDVKATNNTAFIPYDTRGKLKLIFTTDSTDDISFFVQNTNANNFMAADVFDIKLLLDGVVVAHYDMSTGTVQDQSGNGNHATLTGGTWVDDGTGGGTGTAGSITFDTKQVVYKSSSTLFDTLQRIYKTGSAMFDTKQAIYKTMTLYADLLQRIYKPSSVEFETKQIIHKQSQVNFDTLQQIYKSGSFDANILIRILEDFEVYDQIINEVFKINPVLNYEFTVTREIQKDFKINREVNKTFKI